jgi:peptidoglycan/LPS O-acetylase OafA/YrhL
MPHRQFGLDVIRSVAILSVLFCHYGDQGGLLPQAAVPGLWATGFAGVELFFVLSGFLIGGILVRTLEQDGDTFRPGSLLNFWLRRWFRTLPSYFLFLTLFLHYSWPGWRTALLYAGFGQNLLHTIPPVFEVSWSLAVEEWFYLLLPLLIFAGTKAGRPPRQAMWLAVAVLLIAPLLWRSVQGAGLPWDGGVRRVVAYRLDALMFGVVLALLARQRPIFFQRLQSPGLFALGAVFAVVAATGFALGVINGGMVFPATQSNLLIFPLFDLGAALMLPWLASLPRPRAWLAVPVEKISLWSYSLYLSHDLLITLVKRYSAQLALAGHPVPEAVQIAAMILLAFAISAALYRWFERPIMELRERFPVSRNSRPAPAT